MTFRQHNACDIADDVGKLIYVDHAILAKVEWFSAIRAHELVYA
jgi:hypothetical protein